MFGRLCKPQLFICIKNSDGKDSFYYNTKRVCAQENFTVFDFHPAFAADGKGGCPLYFYS
jgi:hypothetical protein